MDESANHTSKTTMERLEQLLRAVERHRLMFLYWATASRRNPLAVHSRSGIDERLYGDEIRGWKEMVDAIDPAGEFLWTHRRVLDRYAQEAIGRFGPGEGARPTEPDGDGRGVPVEGGTYPYWSLGEGSDLYLEETSDAILEACRDLAEVAQIEPVLKLLRDASAAARPEQHDRWYTNVVVSWSYLSSLDSLISRMKTARIELAMPPRPDTARPPEPAAERPEPQSVADVVVLFMVIRDLVRIGRDYPDSMPQTDHKNWVDRVVADANVILQQPGFTALNAVMKEPEILAIDVPERFGVLMSTALLFHPQAASPGGSPAEIQTAVAKAMSTCQATASKSVREHMTRLANLMVVSCRCPTGKDVKEFADPARSLQMVHRYWMLASSMVLTQSSVHVGFNPHPLLHLIENIRDRLTTSFSRITHLDGATDAQHACDVLVGMLTEGDFDDLSAAPEWTNGELQKVERFIARARLKVGPREFELTAAEEFFIKQAEHLIAEHDKRCRAAWKRALAEAGAQAVARKPPDVSSGTQGPSPMPQAPSTPEYRAAKIGPLLLALVAADDGIMTLGARLRSLSTRGNAANTYAITVMVQEQLHKWIDPIVQHLKDAEAASNGIGPHLVGLIAEPVAWEVDTRLAIRTLTDQLVGLIYSNGGETEESLVVGAASDLCSRGQRLQAAREALLAVATANTTDSAVLSGSVRPDSTATPSQPTEGPIALTADHYTILSVLAKSPGKCKPVVEVAGAGQIRNRETAGRLLSELAGFGLVHRPHGKRKGYALTSEGLKRCSGPNARA